MKIISWDIGINNLAYCIMEDKNIIKWDVIDILSDIRPETYICEGSLKNGNNCDKKASLYQTIDENRHYYCGTHGKGFVKIPKHEQCQGINKSNQPCQMKAYVYNKCGKYYCKKHQNQSIDECQMYITVDNISFFQRGKFLYSKLDNLKEYILDVDEVVIENQPVHKNPVMKSIQMLLYGYYMMEGIIKKERIREIHLQNATQKMKVYDGPKIECEIKDTHERNKYLAKEHCKYILKDNEEMLNYFNSYDKNDDLADTYLQGLYFLKSNKIV
jgi:hypothetical protein